MPMYVRTQVPDDPTALDRFWPKVKRTETCWVWAGARVATGYGQLRVGGTTWPAHRLAYAWFVGDLHPELIVHHKCCNPSCVNPDHLEQITQAENQELGYSANVSAGRQVTKTHCPRGHEYTRPNTFIHRGKRSCRACRNAAMRAYRARKVAA